MEHKENCPERNIHCLVIHPDSKCPGYGICTCGNSFSYKQRDEEIMDNIVGMNKGLDYTNGFRDGKNEAYKEIKLELWEIIRRIDERII